MGDRERTKQPVEEHRPVEVEGLPAEEDMTTADAAERVDLDPEEQVNRTDRTIAEDDRPEDH